MIIMKQPLSEVKIGESTIKIQVSSPEHNYYYDSKKKLLIESATELVVKPASLLHEIELYSKVLENLTLLINKLSADITNALNAVKANMLNKVDGIAGAQDFNENSWLKHAQVLSIYNLDPCLKIRRDIENKIQELSVELQSITSKKETMEVIHKHIRELLPVLNKAVIDDYKYGIKLPPYRVDFPFEDVNISTVISSKHKKSKTIVSCGKFLCKAKDGSFISKAPVVHGKTMVHEVDSFDSLITEFLVYKRFTKGSDILIATISEIIDFYEEEWDIDLEESIKQDKIVPKKKPRASSFWDSF